MAWKGHRLGPGQATINPRNRTISTPWPILFKGAKVLSLQSQSKQQRFNYIDVYSRYQTESP
jgi:hypothetical protein